MRISPSTRPLSILTLYHRAAWKGVTDALVALKQVHRKYPEVRVTMFGAVPKGPEVPGWVRYYQNPSQAVLVDELYNRSAIYLGASWAEGWALPPAEAMACGCAFVGTDVGGFRDFAVHNETALLSPPKQPDELVRNLCRVIEDESLRRRLQQAGTALIRTFTWERSGMALEEYVREAVGEEGVTCVTRVRRPW